VNWEVIVVGAGITGASTAWHLRHRGLRVLLLERGEPASGGTGRTAAEDFRRLSHDRVAAGALFTGAYGGNRA
jgi:glycine/D-amino acid oxidase-like deaminating enzyme